MRWLLALRNGSALMVIGVCVIPRQHVHEKKIPRSLDRKFWLNFKKFSQTTINTISGPVRARCFSCRVKIELLEVTKRRIRLLEISVRISVISIEIAIQIYSHRWHVGLIHRFRVSVSLLGSTTFFFLHFILNRSSSYKNNYRSECIRVVNAQTKVIIFCKSCPSNCIYCITYIQFT